MIRADLTAMQHHYAAKRSGQSRADYASAIHSFRRPVTGVTKCGYVLAALLVVAAFIGATV